MQRLPFYHAYIENPFAVENTFGARIAQPWAWEAFNHKNPDPSLSLPPGNRDQPWPVFEEIKERLPKPYWQEREEVIDCYWKVWEMAFGNLRRATPTNGFVSDFIATAFNDCTFMWDSAFITLFARYARQVWHFQGTLDNFYAKQHPDGFICREISETNGDDRFERFDPSATGPNCLPLSEWQYYLDTGDRDRLERIFPSIAAYTQWLKRYHTWPEGGYWTTGWGSGMDNQPRFPGMFRWTQPHNWQGLHENFDHAHGTWIDACFQALLANQLIIRIAVEIGRGDEVQDFRDEVARLRHFINRSMWDERTNFFHDLDANGKRMTQVKTIGAYWGLLAGGVPKTRMNRFIAHLDDPTVFKRTHRCPSLSADTPGFDSDGGYWRGAVWAPTNYMLLRGLTKNGFDDLAAEIGRNHLENVVESYLKTGTLWENYSPDLRGEGRSTKDFVGWTGLVPVAVFFEYVIGLHADPAHKKIDWKVGLLEEHGIEDYPFGKDGKVHLRCARRKHEMEEPQVEVRSSVNLTVNLRWPGGIKTVKVKK